MVGKSPPFFRFKKSAVNIMRVLLVEDDPLIGNGLQIGLTKSGFIVDWFTDGQSGLNALIGAPYDAVVLDLTLPKLDGLEVLKQWRSNNQDVPVLILTARDTLDERIKGIQQGAPIKAFNPLCPSVNQSTIKPDFVKPICRPLPIRGSSSTNKTRIILTALLFLSKRKNGGLCPPLQII